MRDAAHMLAAVALVLFPTLLMYRWALEALERPARRRHDRRL